jgi:hypothetical protein
MTFRNARLARSSYGAWKFSGTASVASRNCSQRILATDVPPAGQFLPEELLGGFYSDWSGAVRADFVTAKFAERPFYDVG